MKSVECGPTQIAMIDETGKLFIVGKQQGCEWHKPTFVMEDVSKVSCGRDTIIVVTKSGLLFTIGASVLGHQIQNDVISPQRVAIDYLI